MSDLSMSRKKTNKKRKKKKKFSFVVNYFFSVPGPMTKSETLNQMDELFSKALNGFMLVLSSDGNMIYLSENVSDYLGISQVCFFPVERNKKKKKYLPMMESRNGQGVSLFNQFLYSTISRWIWWAKACTSTAIRAITRNCGNACPRNRSRTARNVLAVFSYGLSVRWPAKEGRSI